MQEPPPSDNTPADIIAPSHGTHPSFSGPVDFGPSPEAAVHSEHPVCGTRFPVASSSFVPPPAPSEGHGGSHGWAQQEEKDSYRGPTCNSSSSGQNGGNLSEFVRYFACREIVAMGLLQFNDKPQNYRAWKRSFEKTVRGLDLTASEEMDLLIKWLGKVSAEHVEQIRAIHINLPDAGINDLGETRSMLWFSRTSEGCFV